MNVNCVDFASHAKFVETPIAASPAVALCDGLELGLVLAVSRLRQHVGVVAVSVYILVLWDQVDIEDADVHLESRGSVPVEVVSLRLVRHRLHGVQTLGVVQVFEVDIARRFDLQLWKRRNDKNKNIYLAKTTLCKKVNVCFYLAQ